MGTTEGDGGRRPDSKQLARQWAILRLLADSGRSFSVKELADQLGASKSTVQRDLATLEHDFALVEEEVGKQKKVYRIDQTIRALDTITFGTMELLALHAASATMATLAGTPLHEDLQSAIAKVRGFLSPHHNGGLDALSRVFVPHARGQVDHSAQSDVIDNLADAIARRRHCKATYHAAWKGTTREHAFRPLRLVWHRSALYLLCSLEGYNDITTLAVQRIQKLDVLPDEFAPPRIDIGAHVRKAFGIFVSDEEQQVEILFDKDIAWRVEERIFHPDEDKTRLDDGRLRYRVRTSAQWEIIPWVMQFGPLAELAQPEKWRQVITDNLAAMRATYAPKTPSSSS